MTIGCHGAVSGRPLMASLLEIACGGGRSARSLSLFVPSGSGLLFTLIFPPHTVMIISGPSGATRVLIRNHTPRVPRGRRVRGAYARRAHRRGKRFAMRTHGVTAGDLLFEDCD
eukprot:scaffold210149_cov33-Tisochrysis_lutea.AAC.4